MTVTLTAEHISAGTRRSLDNCALALAIRDAAPEGTKVKVCCNCAGLDSVYHPFPAKVEKWARAFDAGRHVEPLVFEIEPEVK